MKRTAHVTIVPVSGKPQTKEIDLPDASLGQALASAGIETKDRDITVNGAPADLDKPLAPGSKVELKVQVAERPRGS